jgi:hypothetical protein
MFYYLKFVFVFVWGFLEYFLSHFDCCGTRTGTDRVPIRQYDVTNTELPVLIAKKCK